MKPPVLLINDELQWSNYLAEHFKHAFEIQLVRDVKSAVLILENNSEIKAVITDLTLSPNRKTLPLFGVSRIKDENVL